MPHLIIEYSENLETILDVTALVDELHNSAAALDALPTGGIRTRAVAHTRYQVADGHQDNGFIYVTLRIGQGRTDEVQKEVGTTLFSALSEFVKDLFLTQPLSLGLEIQEINPKTRWKQSNIREFMEQRRNQGCESS